MRHRYINRSTLLSLSLSLSLYIYIYINHHLPSPGGGASISFGEEKTNLENWKLTKLLMGHEKGVISVVWGYRYPWYENIYIYIYIRGYIYIYIYIYIRIQCTILYIVYDGVYTLGVTCEYMRYATYGFYVCGACVRLFFFTFASIFIKVYIFLFHYCCIFI